VTLRELARAVHAAASDAWIHVDVVGDLGALLARLTSRLPAGWGQHASARLAEKLRSNANSAAVVTTPLYLQTLIAGALEVPGADQELHSAAAESYRAGQSLLAAVIAPSPAHRERMVDDADAHLAAAHTGLAAYRRAEHGPQR
jgi:hypothetical protein